MDPKAALFLCAVLLASGSAPAETVTLQPLGMVDGDMIRTAHAGIEKLYRVTVVIAPGKELPAWAYYPPRHRYRAEKLLEFLAALPRQQAGKIIGITRVDISTTKGEYPDWGIFGQAWLGDEEAVVSSFRLGREKVRPELFSARLVKVVNHELGHLFGLDHCPAGDCLMRDAGGRIATVDGESGGLCPACRLRIRDNLR